MGMMRTRHRPRLLLASLTATAALLLETAAPASATTPPATTTGVASVAQVTAGTIAPTITVGGPLAGLVGPIVSSTLGLVASAVSLVPNAVVNPLLSALVSSYSATTPGTNGTITGTVPAPCASPSCYNALSTAINAGIVGVSAGAVQGWVQYDTGGTKPKIQSTSVVGNQAITVPTLNQTLLGLGQITATTSCTESGTSTATASVTTSKILGGADNGGVDIQNAGGILSVRFKNGSFQPLSALDGSGVNLGVSGLSATAASGAGGGYLKVTLHLGLNDLLAMLGLPGLSVTVASASVDLTVSVGAVALVTTPSTAAQAWGLEVGLDLAADVKVSLVGADADLSIPTGLSATTFGNLADIRLGFSSCTAGSPIPPPPATWIGPELS